MPLENTITDEELLSDLQHIVEQLGHVPSYEDVRKHGKHGPATYRRRLGPGWEDVKRRLGWKPLHESFDPVQVSTEDGAWLSGLIDGEGCFRIQKPSPHSGDGKSKSFSPVFCISFRTDDKPLLEQLCNIIQVNYHFHIDNRDYDCHRGMKANPAYKFFVRDLSTLAYHLIPVLERFPLRSKKRYELPWFKLAVTMLLNKRLEGRRNLGYTDEERDLLGRIYSALHDLKGYNADPHKIAQEYNLPFIHTA